MSVSGPRGPIFRVRLARSGPAPGTPARTPSSGAQSTNSSNVGRQKRKSEGSADDLKEQADRDKRIRFSPDEDYSRGYPTSPSRSASPSTTSPSGSHHRPHLPGVQRRPDKRLSPLRSYEFYESNDREAPDNQAGHSKPSLSAADPAPAGFFVDMVGDSSLANRHLSGEYIANLLDNDPYNNYSGGAVSYGAQGLNDAESSYDEGSEHMSNPIGQDPEYEGDETLIGGQGEIDTIRIKKEPVSGDEEDYLHRPENLCETDYEEAEKESVGPDEDDDQNTHIQIEPPSPSLLHT